jgi:hypothetical protein
MSWKRTVVAFWIAAIVSGFAVFAAAGLIGEFLGFDSVAPWGVIVVIMVAAILDLVGAKPPGPLRQVDEDWLGRYRDWVLGLGYGAQLGAGLVTIIPSYGTWAVLTVALITGFPMAGLLGVAFGVGRSLLLLTARKVTSPSDLVERMQRFAGLESRARWVAVSGYAVALLGLGAHVI